MKEIKPELIICSCNSTEHQMVFHYSDDCIYVHIHLVKGSFWQRLKYGIKYIFGHQSRYGAFDEMVLDTKEHARIFKQTGEFLEKIQL